MPPIYSCQMIHSYNKILFMVFPFILATACADSTNSGDTSDNNEEEATAQVVPNAAVHTDTDSGLMIHSEECFPSLLLDSDGNVCVSARSLMNKNPLLTYHYQRVGCNSDTCKQEFVTYSAVQYPKDSVLQQWMAETLAGYYYDVTRQLDIVVNGQVMEDNGDGEQVLKNVGCRPYQGILNDEGKSLFDYYQARVWVIGKGREDEHGPGGRYGCVIYRCWESKRFVSYFVGYSTDEPQWPEHYVCTFDRKDGHKLDWTDIVRPDCIAEFNDLVADVARDRHYRLLRNNKNQLAIEQDDCDYASNIDIKAVGFVADGLAVSTGALAFDQWTASTHILVLPWEKVNGLIIDRYRR